MLTNRFVLSILLWGIVRRGAITTVADRGFSSTLGSVDKAMVSTPKTKAEMYEARELLWHF